MRAYGFARLPDAIPANAVLFDASARLWYGDEPVEGELFTCSRWGETAVGFSFNTDHSDFANAVRAGRIAATAHYTDSDGLLRVSDITLRRTSYSDGATTWPADTRGSALPDHLDGWFSAVLVGAVGANGSMPLRLPANARPEGEGAPLELSIIGDIGQGRFAATDIVPQIEAAADRSIVLHLDSPGGMTMDGRRIYSALAAHPRRVHVTITRAASMAGIIALAGDVRLIERTGSMMLHLPTADPATMEASGLRVLASHMDTIADEFAGIVAVRTRQPKSVATTWIQNATTFTADECLSAGLAHGLCNDMAPAAASASRARFAPIAANGRYRAIRPASAVALYEYGRDFKAGQTVRHKGRSYTATCNTFGAPGLEPDRNAEWQPCR